MTTQHINLTAKDLRVGSMLMSRVQVGICLYAGYFRDFHMWLSTYCGLRRKFYMPTMNQKQKLRRNLNPKPNGSSLQWSVRTAKFAKMFRKSGQHPAVYIYLRLPCMHNNNNHKNCGRIKTERNYAYNNHGSWLRFLGQSFLRHLNLWLIKCI